MKIFMALFAAAAILASVSSVQAETAADFFDKQHLYGENFSSDFFADQQLYGENASDIFVDQQLYGENHDSTVNR